MVIKQVMKGRSDVFLVSIQDIEIPSDWNGRHKTPKYEADLQELMASIKANGILTPLTGRCEQDRVIPSDGFRRLDAATRLVQEGFKVMGKSGEAEDLLIPFRMEPQGTNDADRILYQITRNSGVPFTPMEKADVVKRLIAFGWSVQKVAEKSGFTVTTVNNLLDLASCPQALLNMVDREEIAASTVVEAVREHGAEKAAVIIQETFAKAVENGKAKITPKDLNRATEERASKAAASLVAEVEEGPEGPAEGSEGSGETEPDAFPEPAQAEAPAQSGQTREAEVLVAACAPKPGKPKVNWEAVGPKMKKLIEKAIDASGEKEMRKALTEMAKFYQSTFPEKAIKE